MRTYKVDMTTWGGYNEVTASFDDLKRIYYNLVSIGEWPDFFCWFADMKRAGLVTEVR